MQTSYYAVHRSVFPVPGSVRSHWDVEISHDGGIYPLENIINQSSKPQPPRQLLTLTVTLRGNKK